MFTYVLSDLYSLVVGSLVAFVLRYYFLNVIVITYVQYRRVREHLKYIIAIQKQLKNQPQVNTNQTGHR
jgi:uncharacterized membrane protein